MRDLDREPTAEEIRSTFDLLRESLRPDILSELHSGGFRDAMIEEYGALATATNDLLNMLRRNGFADALHAEDSAAYDNIMARFSTSAQRCRVLIEESANVDEQAMLAIAPAPSGRMN